jgi:glycosyltransferase involved in cell wall biosynthesis
MKSQSLPTLIIIPAFNEVDNIKTTIQAINALSTPRQPLEILVINDGSTDSSSAVARNLGARVIDLPYNLGVGSAVRTGYKYGVQSNFGKIIRFDADGQHQADSIPEMIQQLDTYDIVCATRFSTGVARSQYPIEPFRRFAIRILSALVSRLAGTPITDVTNGFRGVNRAAAFYFTENHPQEYLGDTVDALALAAKAGFSIIEIYSPLNPRRSGRASQNYFLLAYHLVRSAISIIIIATRRRGKGIRG